MILKKFGLLLLLITRISFAQEQQKIITVFFNSNDFSINQDAEKTLNSFFLDSETLISSVQINGFCDDIGSTDANKILSLKRANAVAEYLQDHYNIEVDAVEGNGEIELSSSDLNSDEIRKKNRKSTLKIEFSTKSKKDVPTLLTSYIGYKKLEDTLKIGDKILIENLVFKGSLTHFEDSEIAEKELSRIFLYLKEHPTVEIEIHGHVCCISTSFKDARDVESGKNNLSQTRAKKIYDFLVSKGISENRMTHAGFGRKFPIPNTAELLNKRVEIVIVKL